MAGEFTERPGSRPLTPGTRLAGYVLEEQIGAGGMAIVFRARDEMLGRMAAVKVIAPAMAGNAEFRARFLRESRAIAAVEEPHIIPVYAAGEADGVLYIATRYVAGGDLVGLMQKAGGTLSPDQAADLVSQVAAALDAAHAAGLVHRDVKPANILIDTAPGRTEHAFLSDFGLTKGASSATGLTATGQFLGTPDYCAPEQIRGGPMDGRLDQYALACVAFVLLTGTLPYRRGDTMATLFAHVHDPVPMASMSRAGLSPALDAVLARGMAKAPADRFASCGEFAAALRAALAPRTLLATPTPSPTWQPGLASAPTPTQLSTPPPARTAATGDPRFMAGGATIGVPATPQGPTFPGNAPAAQAPAARSPAARTPAAKPAAAPQQKYRQPQKSRMSEVEWRPILIGAGVVLLLAVMLMVQHVWHVWG